MGGSDVKDEWAVECSYESSEKRLVDGKVGLAYRMDHNQMSVDRPWDIFSFLVSCEFFFKPRCTRSLNQTDVRS